MSLSDALDRAVTDLRELGAPFALVGGLAVSIRTEPRFTRDADIAVSVASDVEAERLVHALVQRRYQTSMLVEREATGRLATIRLTPPEGVVVCDLLFASSGIEPEIVMHATIEDAGLRTPLPVASIGHLIAMKILSREDARPQDQIDLVALRRAQGQFFLDGNKRTAVLSTFFFLGNNGHKLRMIRDQMNDLIWGFASPVDDSSVKPKYKEEDAIQYVFDHIVPVTR